MKNSRLVAANIHLSNICRPNRNHRTGDCPTWLDGGFTTAGKANLAMFQDTRFSQAVLTLIAAEHCGGS